MINVREGWESLVRRSYRQVDGSSLAVFRIVFGLMVCVYAVKALALGEVKGIYVDPAFHFSYWGFGWLKPWPGDGMYLHFAAIAVMSLMVAAGIAYRFAAIALALLYTFLFLCERTGYLNHYYLVTLLCWMMVVLPADRVASLDRLGKPCSGLVPVWAIWMARLHVAVPYFYGGIAKLREDWLMGQPMTMTLSAGDWFAPVTEYVSPRFVVLLFAWGGLFFDLLIVPALLWKPTRRVAYCLAVGFHLTNAFVFPIGIFPWLMIGATTIFFAPDWPRRLFAKKASVSEAVAGVTGSTVSISRRQKLWIGGLCCYLLLHCLIPLRHYVTHGDPNWTERGHCFAWHMMLRGKRSALRMYVTDPETRETYSADLRRYLTAYQYPKVARDPEHIRQLAHHIARSESRDGRVPQVRAFSLVSLNGRKAELLVDPKVDLAQQHASWLFPSWIEELDNPLLLEFWDVNLLNWEDELGLHGDDIIREVTGGEVIPGGSNQATKNTRRMTTGQRASSLR